MKELHIFVDSERPDQYINSLVHSVLDREVRKIVFLHIKKLTTSEQSCENTGLSARVLAAVSSQIESLADRKEYIFTEGPRMGEHISLKDEYGKERSVEIAALYQRVRKLPLKISNEEVDYEQLRAVLAEIAKKGRNAFVDITAVKKRYLGDIVAAGLVEGIEGLWTFDLQINSPDFSCPWKMLIHDLNNKDTNLFKYTNILDTATYKSCVRLVMVRAPKIRFAAAATIGLMLLGAIGYIYLGENNSLVKTILAVSGLASIASLVFVFWVPRS